MYRTTNRDGKAMPVALHLHGGCWVAGSREHTALSAPPYLQMGFMVVNATARTFLRGLDIVPATS